MVTKNKKPQQIVCKNCVASAEGSTFCESWQRTMPHSVCASFKMITKTKKPQTNRIGSDYIGYTLQDAVLTGKQRFTRFAWGPVPYSFAHGGVLTLKDMQATDWLVADTKKELAKVWRQAEKATYPPSVENRRRSR